MPETPRNDGTTRGANAGEQEAGPICGESLAEIVTACQSGDRGAFRRLFDACHANILGLVRRITGEQDADDVTQQVFLQVFRSIDQFRGDARMETWLYRLAVNESLQYLRRIRRRRFRSLDWEPAESSQAAEAVERKELLEQALERIDPQLRSVFLLREVEGMSYHDISEVVQIPEGTVGSRLNRARRELKFHLSALGLEPS